jgi:predicted negative regulator of RcsB-dependent stress response
MNWNQWTTLFRDYLDLINRFAEVSKDPSNSGVAAVVYADDVLQSKGPEQAIAYFEKILPEVTDPAVQRAIRLRLAEHYRLTNQPDKALAQLHLLMVAPHPNVLATSPPAAAGK